MFLCTEQGTVGTFEGLDWEVETTPLGRNGGKTHPRNSKRGQLSLGRVRRTHSDFVSSLNGGWKGVKEGRDPFPYYIP